MKELTVRGALELVGHEAIVLEWYTDSIGIGTWGIGVTNASEHLVDRYKDKPQTVEKVLEIFIWLLRTKYIPQVLKAFDGHELSESQFAAALSFHYNTGAIGKADWVKQWKAGCIEDAKRSFLNYRKPASIIPRRTAERNLFFDAKWANDGHTTIWPVKKPAYTPDWAHGKRVDIREDMEKALAA